MASVVSTGGGSEAWASSVSSSASGLPTWRKSSGDAILVRVRHMALPDSQELANTRTVPSEALRALVNALHEADFGASGDVLHAFAAVTVDVCAADAAVVRLANADGSEVTGQEGHSTSPARAAARPPERPPRRASRESGVRVSVDRGGGLLGSLDVLRDGTAFSDDERL